MGGIREDGGDRLYHGGHASMDFSLRFGMRRVARVMASVARQLAVALLCAGICLAGETGRAPLEEAETDYASWAVDPSVPGPDLPPRGRSLFDHLVTEPVGGGRRYHVPYPLPALVERIRTTLAEREFLGGTRMAVIPMGRSLQRAAAAPDFFRFPRFVFAVTGEPTTREHQPVVLLQDRLYIGYVEKTAMLEVISYNEAAGRFEFQIVKDYRPGAQPRVVYAHRAVCIACHQNHAPIFSRALWGETNANAAVAARLRAERGDMDMSPQANIDFPDDIDKSTVRANNLISMQTLWRSGCSDPKDLDRARRCRAAVLTAVLQRGLSDEEPGSAAAAELTDFLGVFTRAWKRLWPEGLRIAQSALPDRTPIGAGASAYGANTGVTDDDLIAASHVPAGLDPLTPRPPREIWRLAGAQDAYRFIPAWVRFFAASDFIALDAHLRQRKYAGATRTDFRSSCAIEPVASSSTRFTVRCAGSVGIANDVATAGGFTLRGGGRLEWMNFGPAGQVTGITLDNARYEEKGGEHILHTTPRKGSLAARLGDGRLLESIEFRWPAANSATPAANSTRVRVAVVDDFAPVRAAVLRLLSAQPTLFDDGPLVRVRLMTALYRELGMPAQPMCCAADDNGMPAAVIDAPETSARAVTLNDWQPFYRHCGACHLTAEPFPPNFLAGDVQRVARNFRQCAPRMLARLAHWNTAESNPVKSPMPPVTGLLSQGTRVPDWLSSPDLQQLRRYVEKLVLEHGRPTDLPELLAPGYEALPRCLPTDE